MVLCVSLMVRVMHVGMFLVQAYVLCWKQKEKNWPGQKSASLVLLSQGGWCLGRAVCVFGCMYMAVGDMCCGFTVMFGRGQYFSGSV